MKLHEQHLREKTVFGKAQKASMEATDKVVHTYQEGLEDYNAKLYDPAGAIAS